MKKIILLILFLTSLNIQSQDLQVQWFDTDQRMDKIKSVWVADANGNEQIKDFPAKNSVDIINQFKQKGYKVFSIDHVLYGNSMKTIVWFTKEE